MNHFKDQYKQIGEGVWSWENFLSEEEIIPIMEEIRSREWIKGHNHHRDFTTFSKYKERIINSLNMPNASIEPLDNVIVRYEGQGMHPHVDIQNYFNLAHYNEIEKTSDVEKIKLFAGRYSFIIYFNDDYTGGEICYPMQDLYYKPKAGTIVVHDVKNVHAVKKVESGLRFTHSSQIQDEIWISMETFKKIDFPNKDFIEEDSRFFYSVHHGESENPSLKKFMETYIHDETYNN
jgi:hypothetical protein